MNVLVTLNPGIGEDLGPNFTITCDVEGWSQIVSLEQLLEGVLLIGVPDGANYIYIQSLGICLNILTIPIETTSTSTSTTSTSTSSSTTTTTSTTTEEPVTTTTSTTTEIECIDGYSYNVSFYACDNCTTSLGDGTICNESKLTVGKWYYDPNSQSVIHVTGFVECGCENLGTEILDEVKRNFCNEVECITTTTTTTEYPVTTTTTTTEEEITTTTTTTTMSIECMDNGLLYNFFAIENLNNVAPDGYRAATLVDIVNLVDYLGGELVAGGEMKSTGLWQSPNTGATDSVGFEGIPSGRRSELGVFTEILLKNYIWIDNR